MIHPILRGAALLLLVLPPLSAQGADTLAPPHRRHHALTYDPVSRQLLLSGGQHLAGNDNSPPLDDLWSWDGTRWTRVAAGTGPGMLGHKLFADGAGGVFITANAYGVTARWNGNRWITVLEDGGTRREMAAGAWDARRKRFVLFGGHVGGQSFPGDTWEFDGTAWTRAAAEGPPPMLGGAMAFDTRRNVMVLFGGLEPAGHKLDDTWEWNGTAWTRVSSTGPSPRFGAGIAYDMQRGETVLFGGVDSANTKLADTWLWNGQRWRRADGAEAPPPRSEGYMAYDERRWVVVMFGGEGAVTVPTLGDTWEWNGVRWRKVGR